MRSFLVGAHQYDTVPTILGPTNLDLERAVLPDALRRLGLGRGQTWRSCIIPDQVIFKFLAPLDHLANTRGRLGLGHTPRRGIIHDQVICLALLEHLATTEVHTGRVTTKQWELFGPAPVVENGIDKHDSEHACHSRMQCY